MHNILQCLMKNVFYCDKNPFECENPRISKHNCKLTAMVALNLCIIKVDLEKTHIFGILLLKMHNIQQTMPVINAFL